ncbi:MAG: hypothetical protein JWL82_227 [Parcubacteria group bacterium]|nr:hypothetical protein [Parcubacteria group bacterium]
MSLLSFGKKTQTIALIDVRSSSIGAAYVLLESGASPTLIYSTRVPMDPHATEPLEEALPRTLELALNSLTKKGSTLLRKVSGKGNVDRALVTLTTPWQTSRVFSTVIEEERPFLFTQKLVSAAASKQTKPVDGHTVVSQMAIATLLNGYEVENPFGKKIKRAELIMLSSSLKNDMMELVRTAVRKSLHQSHIEFAAFMPESYAVFRDLYPHQRDFLIMDVGNEAAEVLLAKHGLLISTSCMPHGYGEMARAARSVGFSSPILPLLEVGGEQSAQVTKVEEAKTLWLSEIRTSLSELAKHEPLPRTVFLLAEENVRDFLRRLIDSPTLRSLWLSEEALSILPIQPGQFSSYIKNESGEPLDPALSLIALAAKKRFS